MNNTQPIFKPIFGSMWENLPPVFQKRYMNHAFSNDISSVEGEMDINYSKTMSFLIPLFRLLHVLVPYRGKNIPVKVDFRSRPDSNAVYLERKFYFPEKPPYEFNSHMEVINATGYGDPRFRGDDVYVIERMAFGMGWKTHYFYDGKKVVMQHKNYVLRIFGFDIPVPLEIFVGKGHAEEEVIDDNSYRVSMTMTHPLFGIMYNYAGNFTFKRPSS